MLKDCEKHVYLPKSQYVLDSSPVYNKQQEISQNEQQPGMPL